MMELCAHRKWQKIHSIVGSVFDPIHDVAFAPNLGRYHYDDLCKSLHTSVYLVLPCRILLSSQTDHTMCWQLPQKMLMCFIWFHQGKEVVLSIPLALVHPSPTCICLPSPTYICPSFYLILGLL